jgi:ATP-dependent DNA helicase PIF1
MLQVLNKLPGTTNVFKSCDSVRDESNRLAFPTEFLNGLSINGMPEHRLPLKLGCTVMLLRNLDPEHGDCNGSRYVVTKICPNQIVARNLTGTFVGKTTYIPKCKIIDDSGIFPFQLVRIQFPLKLSYAMTVNKSQGQTLRKVALYLPQPCFAHGQLYTTLSRVGTWQDIIIMCDESKRLSDGRYRTSNIVYTEILA